MIDRDYLVIDGKPKSRLFTVAFVFVALVVGWGFLCIAAYKLMAGDAQTAIVSFLIQVLIWLLASRFVKLP